MPNPERVIKYTAPCPRMVWSGALDENRYFGARAEGTNDVPTAVVIAGAADRDVERVEL